MSVTRYDCGYGACGTDPDGGMVDYDDYADLEAERDALRERCEKLEWLAEVQKRYALAIIDMDSGQALRSCAIDELGLSYVEAAKLAGVTMPPHSARRLETNYFAWALAATEVK